MTKRNGAEKIERVHEENRKLKLEIANLHKEIRKLKSKNRTLNSAWQSSEDYLQEVTDGRSVEEIVKNVNKGKRLSKFESSCSKCKSDKIQVLKFKNFRVVVCEERNCKHKEKIDGSETEE